MTTAAAVRKDDDAPERRALPRLLSIVTPAFNEAENLPHLWTRLDAVLAQLDLAWEWIIVDDASDDATPAAIAELAHLHPCVHGVRQPRRAGSHAAILRGCRQTQGEVAVVLTADLQDPPEIIPTLLAAWRSAADVVWAARPPAARRRKRGAWTGALYYWLMRHVAGLRGLPAHGADLVLIDDTVLHALRRWRGEPSSVFALIAALGRRQTAVPCARGPRIRGRSGWTLVGRTRLAIASLAEFSAARLFRTLPRGRH